MSTSVIPAAPHETPETFTRRMRRWWIILRIALAERLVYRGDFILGTAMRFLPMITQIFLWTAVFAGGGGIIGNGGVATIAGYTKNDLIAYYLLAMVTRAFSSMPGLASGIAKSIRDGTIKKFLTQPVDMLGFMLLGRVAHKLVYYLVASVPFAVVFYLGRGYFTSGWPDPLTFLAYCVSLCMSFVLGFYLEAAMGLVGFWFLEISSLVFVYTLISYFLSGQMFPLDMLDKYSLFSSFTLGDLVRLLPLQYLAYFPAAVFLGKIQGTRLVIGLLAQFAWLMFFVIACRIGFNRGVRRYSAFGG